MKSIAKIARITYLSTLDRNFWRSLIESLSLSEIIFRESVAVILVLELLKSS
jgi:hypothetical protein